MSGPLIVSTRFAPFVGGQEQATASLAAAFVARGAAVTVLTETLGLDLPRREVFGGVTVTRIPSPESRSMRIQILVALRTAWFVWQNRTTTSWILIRTYSASAAAVGALKWFRLLKVPTMVTSDTGGAADDIRALRAYRFSRVFVRLISAHDRLNALSAGNVESLQDLGFPMAKVVRLPNGVDVSAWHTARQPMVVRTFVCVGRIETDKGVFTLLESFEAVSRAFPSARLDFIGDGRAIDELRRRVLERGLEHVVRVRGAIPHEQLQCEYERYDCVVIPSPAEGFCLVAYEALAHRRIVIATDVADLRARFGSLIAFCSSPTSESLTERMLDVLQGELPPDRESDRVLVFSVESVAQQLDEMLMSASARATDWPVAGCTRHGG